MGEAYVAVSHDANACLYNPAGLTELKIAGAALSYKNAFNLMNATVLHATGAVAVSSKFAFGFDFQFNKLGARYCTSESGYMTDQKNLTGNYAVGISAARKLNQYLAFGVTARFIRSELNLSHKDYTSRNMNFDFALMLRRLFSGATIAGRNPEYSEILPLIRHRLPPGLSIGLCITNMGPAISYSGSLMKDPQPQTFRLGCAFTVFDTDALGLIAALDAEKLLAGRDDSGNPIAFYKALGSAWTDRSFIYELREMTYHLGIEATLFYFSAFRFGLIYDEIGRYKTFTFGLGLGSETVRINVAFLPGTLDSDYAPRDMEWYVSFSSAF
ncbi:hypothetical protein JXJ21_15585 [candidate division KSB1 bacterium]|nr:hypothetical protein [candidate division KSB1 bacterium]